MENELRYRIVSYNPKTYKLEAISYHKTQAKADKELRRMVKDNECDKDLLYFTQQYVECPVKTMEDRVKYLDAVREYNRGILYGK